MKGTGETLQLCRRRLVQRVLLRLAPFAFSYLGLATIFPLWYEGLLTLIDGVPTFDRLCRETVLILHIYP